jgi:DNA-binding CsgD family transcriptional regulator/TolB-like protein
MLGNESVSKKTRIPLLFLNMFDCPGSDEQAHFFARRLPSDIGRWSSTAPYHVTVGRPSDMSLRANDIGERYQADYMLSGDLMCSKEGISSSVMIYETSEGRQMWAKTYEFNGEDTRELVDTLAGTIAAAISMSFYQFEVERLKGVPEAELDAWGLAVSSMGFSMRNDEEAREWLRICRLAVSRDENYAEAHANLADGIVSIVLAGFDCSSSNEQLVHEALHNCDRAITLDKDSVYNLNRCSRVHRVLGSRILSLQLAERVDELTLGLFTYTLYPSLIANGRSDEVVEHARNNPKATLSWASDACVITGDFEEAESVIRLSVTRSPSTYLGWMRLANVLGLLNRKKEAGEALAEANRIGPPGWDLENYIRSLRISWRDNADILHPLTSGLRAIEVRKVPFFDTSDMARGGMSAEGALLNQLSNRQREVLSHALKGMLNKVIASELNIAEGTVKAHLSAAFKVLEVKNRTEAVYLLSLKNTAIDF